MGSHEDYANGSLRGATLLASDEFACGKSMLALAQDLGVEFRIWSWANTAAAGVPQHMEYVLYAILSLTSNRQDRGTRKIPNFNVYWLLLKNEQ